MTCREHCAHWRVCENITDPSMKEIVNGNEVEKHCSSFLNLSERIKQSEINIAKSIFADIEDLADEHYGTYAVLSHKGYVDIKKKYGGM